MSDGGDKRDMNYREAFQPATLLSVQGPQRSLPPDLLAFGWPHLEQGLAPVLAALHSRQSRRPDDGAVAMRPSWIVKA